MTVLPEEPRRIQFSLVSPVMWQAIGIAAVVMALGVVLVCISFPEALDRIRSLF